MHVFHTTRMQGSRGPATRRRPSDLHRRHRRRAPAGSSHALWRQLHLHGVRWPTNRRRQTGGRRSWKPRSRCFSPTGSRLLSVRPLW